jgi:hypothetical protein
MIVMSCETLDSGWIVVVRRVTGLKSVDLYQQHISRDYCNGADSALVLAGQGLCRFGPIIDSPEPNQAT